MALPYVTNELLEPDALLDGARTAVGCDLWELAPFAASELSEPLDLLCADLESHAQLTPQGRELTRRYLVRLLMVRRQLDAYATADPEVTEATIAAPVFVIGAPRTGTTIVHRLAAMVPGLRAPEGWELLYPVPPPTSRSAERDERVAWAADELTAPQRAADGLRRIHTYSARMPKECLSAMALSLRSEEFLSRYDLPNYRKWLQSTDMAPAYALHRLVLSVLQRHMTHRRWTLKSPVHLQNLPTLLATYPDARFVLTHRDPLALLSSVSSLVATLRSAFSSTVDPVAIGRYHLDLYAHSLRELSAHLDSGLIAEDRVVHLRHGDIVVDPASEVVRALDVLGIAGAQDIAIQLAAEAGKEREDSLGSHHHDPADFGLDEIEVRTAFAEYRERFVNV